METNAISVQMSRGQTRSEGLSLPPEPRVKDCLFPQKTKSEGLSLPLKEVNKAVGTTGAFQLSLILKAVPLHLCWVAL